jgi:hypothetical protein
VWWSTYITCRNAIAGAIRIACSTGIAALRIPTPSDRKPFSEWIEKHNRYAVREAKELLRLETASGNLRSRLFGTQAERARWLRERLYNRLPPLLRPCLFFFYRVVIRGAVLDGWKALTYHFLQAFWYPLLIDIYFLEMSRAAPESRNAAYDVQLSHEHSLSRR